jgi:hypothetical protein
MAEQRRSAPVKPDVLKSGEKRKVAAAKSGTVPMPADPASMVQDGNRPHETTLHGTELEDFGLDVRPVIQPHTA